MAKQTCKYPCPCCGYLVFQEVGGYEICPFCAWEDDISQLRLPTTDGGCNRVSLIEAQINFQQIGVSDKRFKDSTTNPGLKDERDPQWRPLINVEVDNIEVPDDDANYRTSYPKNRTRLFYWRENFWRNEKNRL